MTAKESGSGGQDERTGGRHAGGATPEEQRFQHLLITAADHEVLSRSIESFQRLFAGDRSPDAAAEFKNIKWLLYQKLPEHFAYEDRHVFPALLAENPP